MKRLIRKIRFLPFSWFFIPRGLYCYKYRKLIWGKNKEDPPKMKIKICPYWEKLNNLLNQENGYCHYLKKSDYDINNDEHKEFMNVKTGEIIKAPYMPIAMSLLWDQCKECGIKKYYLKE